MTDRKVFLPYGKIALLRRRENMDSVERYESDGFRFVCLICEVPEKKESEREIRRGREPLIFPADPPGAGCRFYGFSYIDRFSTYMSFARVRYREKLQDNDTGLLILQG